MFTRAAFGSSAPTTTTTTAAALLSAASVLADGGVVGGDQALPVHLDLERDGLHVALAVLAQSLALHPAHLLQQLFAHAARDRRRFGQQVLLDTFAVRN